jgi:peptidoglycan/LPS O-acetylase OafA/YrhL
MALHGANTAQQDHLPELTSLRFIAAFAVLVLHYRDLFGPLPDAVLRAIVGGQYGVTFFFVLSGFILTYRYHDWFDGGVRDGRFWRFQRLRFARIYPIYLLGLLLDTPWHLIERAQAGQLAEVGQTWWASWLLNLVGLQAWVPAVPFAMFWNTPAWSVAAEFFFYATFPFVCAGLLRLRLRLRGLALLMAATVALGIAAYVAVIWWMNFVLHAEPQTQYIVLVYNPLLRYSEFLGGCLTGLAFLQLRAGSSPRAAWLTGTDARARRVRDAVVLLALVAVGVRIGLPDYTGPEMWRWLLDVAMKYGIFIVPFSALILAVASGRTFLSLLLQQPWMVLLGEASYALYIIHWSVTTFLRLGWLGEAGTPAVHGLFLLGTVAASVLCYRFIEVPWRRRLRGTAGADTLDATADAASAAPLQPQPRPALP